MAASSEPRTGEEQPGGAPRARSSSAPVNGAAGPAANGRLGHNRAPRLRLPDFFIVGHPKCGTTALYRMLSQHPDLYMPLKESRYFAPELRTRFHRFGPDRLPHTLEEYLRLFTAAREDQRAGEASPSYLRSRHAAERITQLQPEARIIAILRDPASFLRSFHLQSVHNHTETQKDFGKAIALEAQRRRGKRIPRLSHSPEALMYSEHVRYVDQLRRFHAHFPREQVLVLIYDDFRADNRATVREVLRFLDVDETVAIEPSHVKPLPGVRSQTLHQMGRVVSVARRNRGSSSSLLRAANALVPGEIHSERLQSLWRRVVYTPPPVPDEGVMLELRRRFKGEVLAASEYLDRDLVTLWGYDEID
jgi:Sulfotransferase domain